MQCSLIIFVLEIIGLVKGVVKNTLKKVKAYTALIFTEEGRGRLELSLQMLWHYVIVAIYMSAVTQWITLIYRKINLLKKKQMR
jgi:hypothetical protein